MNKILLKHEIKAHWIFPVAFMLLIAMYVVIMMSMYDPDATSILDTLAEAMPEYMALLGMNNAATDFISFLINYLYGMILLVFPMISTLVVANRLIVRYVDKGSMATFLAAPCSRKEFVTTQLIVNNLFIVITIVFTTILTIICGQLMFPGELNIGKLLIINFGLLIMQYFVGSVYFLASCITNEVKYYTIISAGFLIYGYLTQMLANLGDKLDFFKYFTYLSLYDVNGLKYGNSSAFIMIAILFIAGTILNVIGIRCFCKRDLSL